MKLRPLLFSAVSLCLSASAVAQTNPTFIYAKPEAPPPAAPATPPPPPPPPPVVEWKAQVKGGFLMTAGNSETTGTNLGAGVSRKEGNNRLTLDGGIAYGRSDVLAPTITPGVPATMTTAAVPPMITSLPRTEIETTNNWFTKGRYDRFFTLNNSGYVSAQAAADQIAGKSFYGGGQIGYSRQVYKSTMNLAVAEIGYDLSFERYVQIPMTTHDPVTIHSARLFLGETLTVTKATGITAGVEALFNLNKETNALIATDNPTSPPATGVAAFKDTRLTAKLALTTMLLKRLSISFGFTFKYDENPAPLPIPSGSPPGTVFAIPQPFAQTIDTATEATLIYTFL